jgi:SEL1 protein
MRVRAVEVVYCGVAFVLLVVGHALAEAVPDHLAGIVAETNPVAPGRSKSFLADDSDRTIEKNVEPPLELLAEASRQVDDIAGNPGNQQATLDGAAADTNTRIPQDHEPLSKQESTESGAEAHVRHGQAHGEVNDDDAQHSEADSKDRATDSYSAVGVNDDAGLLEASTAVHAAAKLSAAVEYEMKLRSSAILDKLMKEAESLYTDDGDQRAALKHFRIAAVLGHSGAMTTVGTLLSAGDTNISRDLSSGVRYLRMAADLGQPDALAFFGFLHASGIADRFGIEKNEGKALLYLKVAAGTGSIVADMSLGYRYLHGVGVVKSCALASEHYRAAARAVATDSRYLPSLENFMKGNPPIPTGLKIEDRARLTDESLENELAGVSSDSELVEYYRLLASQGDAEHLTTIGGLQLFGGNGLEPDEGRARADLERAAQLGHGQAHGMLAHLALNRHDNVTALFHFRRAAAAADGMGYYGLGMMHLHGIGVEQDHVVAAKYFKRAVDTAHADAAYQLGVMYWRGMGVEENAVEAFRLFQVGARLGQVQAKMNVGLILIEGKHPVTEPDCRHGVKYLKAVAESGEWKPLLNLALDQLENGDMFGALYRYMQAAYAGIEVAQYNAAMLLEKGAAEILGSFSAPLGTVSLDESEELQHWDADRMLSEAFDLYEMSAEQGHSSSLLRMGDVAYSEANDYKTAASAYKKGAAMQNAEATFSLGWMYLRGFGVSADRRMAIRYLEMSKRYSPEAVVPATIAVFVARTVWWLVDTMYMFAGPNGYPPHGSERTTPRTDRSGLVLQWDALVVAGLVGLMTVILLVRRRRLHLQHSEI